MPRKATKKTGTKKGKKGTKGAKKSARRSGDCKIPAASIRKLVKSELEGKNVSKEPLAMLQNLAYDICRNVADEAVRVRKEQGTKGKAQKMRISAENVEEGARDFCKDTSESPGYIKVAPVKKCVVAHLGKDDYMLEKETGAVFVTVVENMILALARVAALVAGKKKTLKQEHFDAAMEIAGLLSGYTFP